LGYAETTDLNLSDRRLIELTDSEDAPGVLDQDVLDRTLTETQSIIDSLLRTANLPVPFPDDAVPPVIKVITPWIWAYRLFRHREVMEIPKPIVDDYTRAMGMISQILDGSISLNDIGDDALTSPVPEVGSSCDRGWTHRSRTRL
jgi:phage gp36-like protein